MITAEQAMKAGYHLGEASRHADIAHVVKTYSDTRFYLDALERQFRLAAAELGFNISRRPVINAECKAAHDAELAALAEAGYMDISEYVMGR